MIHLSHVEQETIYKLAEKILGVSQKGKFRKNILVRNIEIRISVTETKNLSEYLQLVNQNKTEYCHFISALTIHTTNWFREPPHFEELEKYLNKNISKFFDKPFIVLSAACSTGEEVYSLGLLLEQFRQQNPRFDYQIYANDIDPICIGHAKQSLFPKINVTSIPQQYHRNILLGKNKYKNYFTVSKEIRKRVTFINENILHPNWPPKIKFNLICCRNVLIYFEFDNIVKIINSFINTLSTNGILCLGHSEALNSPKEFRLKLVWNSSYTVITSDNNQNSEQYDNLVQQHIKHKTILVVDDSITVRRVLEKLYSKHGLKTLLAENAHDASRLLDLHQQNIDLISLDLHMPEISGQEWLTQIRSKGIKIPVIVITDASSDEAIEVLGALENGAQDYLNKSELHQDENLVIEKINSLIESHYNYDEAHGPTTTPGISIHQNLFRPDVILIGASTGGPEAINYLLAHFDKNSPPIVMVQHISPSFANAFYKRICKTSTLQFDDIKNGTLLKSGHLYAATDDFHIGIKKDLNEYSIITDQSSHVNRHRPSVDYLFESANNFADKVAGILLTGMGRDGAEGLYKLKKNGALSFIQNENSCVVYGMPKVAIELGAHGFVGDIGQIRQQMNQFITL